MGSSEKQHHIVMLPAMAHGHLIPFLALAKQISQTFHFKITIAATPLNVQYLQTAIANTSHTSHIHFSPLPYNSSDHGLPPNIENTEALPLGQVAVFFQSTTSLRLPFQTLIHRISAEDGAPPLCLISDVFMGWANDVALSCGTVNLTFTTGGAYGTAAYMSLWEHLPHRRSNNDEFNLPGFPDSHTFHTSQLHQYLRVADGTDPWSRFFQPQIANSKKSLGWLCNTAAEMEPLGLDILIKYTNLPIWCTGPLLPPAMFAGKSSRVIGQHTGREPGISPEKCLRWLDSCPKSSVLFISFGSQNSISPNQMMALAEGLEDSGKPFIWVIRPPTGFDIRGEFKSEWLPDGFEERNSQGLVVRKWAPQLEILCHESTAAFVSHCGWNSIVESLSQGVPMIGWPLAAEQGYNAKMLVEEMGVCVELTRGTQSSISREDVRRVIETVVGGGDKAEEMKKKAAEIGAVIRAALSENEGSSVKAMNDFVSAVLSAKSAIDD